LLIVTLTARHRGQVHSWSGPLVLAQAARCSEGLCARRPHPTGHATRAVFFPPQVFVEDDGHPEDEEPRTEIETQPRERGESPKQEKHDGHEHQCGADDEQRPLPPQPVASTPADPPKPPGSTTAARPHLPPIAPPCTAGSPWWAHRQAVTGTGGRTRPAAVPTVLGWAVAPRVPPGHRRSPRPRAGA